MLFNKKIFLYLKVDYKILKSDDENFKGRHAYTK